MHDGKRDPPSSQNSTKDQPPVLNAKELFRGTREVLIDHDGVTYRLRITKHNKLILQR
ncbi:MAG: hypothetical protein KatS3mg105_3758 [Gemmatales bacterium]|nr:MAG: hypothetical protein KatS3mg105_3758 [Gemmatales bacterium]